MKQAIVQLETHVAHGCNFTCESCTHFSQEGYSGRETVQSFREHNAPWAERLAPRYFLVLGGEPTLNPDLCEVLEEARRLWADADIMLVTNGWFLHKHPRLAEVLPANRIHLDVSVHHGDPRYTAKLRQVEQLAASWGVPVRWRESYRDWTRVYHGSGAAARPFADGKPADSWKHCVSKWCMTLLDGLLYKCPMVAYVPVHAAKYGAAGWEQYTRYKPLPPTCTDEELAAFAVRTVEFECGMCPAQPKHLAKAMPARDV